MKNLQIWWCFKSSDVGTSDSIKLFDSIWNKWLYNNNTSFSYVALKSMLRQPDICPSRTLWDNTLSLWSSTILMNEFVVQNDQAAYEKIHNIFVLINSPYIWLTIGPEAHHAQTLLNTNLKSKNVTHPK